MKKTTKKTKSAKPRAAKPKKTLKKAPKRVKVAAKKVAKKAAIKKIRDKVVPAVVEAGKKIATAAAEPKGPPTLPAPFPVGEAALGFAEMCFNSAKTVEAEAVMKGATKLVNDGANAVERSLAIMAYSVGGGSVAKIIKLARDGRDGEFKPLLQALKKERLPNDDLASGGGRDVIGCEAIDYQIAAVLTKFDPQHRREADRLRGNLETALGRKLTAEERASYGEVEAPKLEPEARVDASLDGAPEPAPAPAPGAADPS